MAAVKALHDKVVWITGGGSGIGRELALEATRRGATVAVSGRRLDRLEEVASECRALGGQASAVVCDVTDEASVEAAVQQVLAHHFRLDVVIANAGFSVAGRMETLTADDWRRQFETNVIGLVNTAKATLPELRRTAGRLALVGSVAGMICVPGAGAYHASKHAVRAIGQVLAMELHGSGVSVTTIHPGFVRSEIAQVDNRGVFDGSRPDRRPDLLMWETDRAARVMLNAIQKRKREFTFTAHGKLVGFLGRHFPGLVHFAVTRAGIENKP